MYDNLTLDYSQLRLNDKHTGQFFPATIVGQIFDTYGPRVLLIVGTILIGLSLILTSIATQYWQLMVCQGVVFGFGSAMLYNPGVSGKPTTGTSYALAQTHSYLQLPVNGSSRSAPPPLESSPPVHP
jgi:hypothetical protein